MLFILFFVIVFSQKYESSSSNRFTQGINRDEFEITHSKTEKGYPKQLKQLVTGGEDAIVTYNKAPHRIVAVWQNSIETLLALGVGQDIIAAIGVPKVDYISPEYRESYNNIPYKSMQMPDKESLLYNEPDFILGWYSTFDKNVFGNTQFWQSRGINTYIASSSYGRKENKSHDLQEEYEYITQVGEIVNKEEIANQLITKLKQQVDYVRAQSLEQNKRPKALIIELMGKEMRLYNERTLAGNIVNEVGGELLLPKESSISYEELITINPDVLFVVVIESEYDVADKVVDRFYKNPALQSLRVVKNRSIKVLPLYAIYSPGIRVKDGIEIISEGLYPNLKNEVPNETLVRSN